MLEVLHDKLVFTRRVRVLADAIAERLPRNAHVLDVGCGSGDLAELVMTLRPDVRIEGIDVELLDGIGHMPHFAASEAVAAFVRRMAGRSLGA